MIPSANPEPEYLNTNEQTWIYVNRWIGWCWSKLRRGNHSSLDDAKQELWLRLFEVFRRFDPAKSSGHSYALYALKLTRVTLACFDHEVTREVAGLTGKVIEIEQKLTTLHERKPTTEEIASRLETSVENVRQVQWRLRRHEWSSANRAESRGDFDLKFELLSYDDEDRLNLVATAAVVMPRVEAIMKTRKREREVLFSRSCGKTWREIGRQVGVGRERARQISSEAARECRNELLVERALKRKLITHDCMVPPNLLLENEGV